MRIYLNETALEISENITLQDVLSAQLNISPDKKGIAVAVNEHILSRQEWSKYILKENDRVLVIIAAQGG